MMLPDAPQITIQDEGSLVILTALTPEAELWLIENLDPDVQRWGNLGFVIERRYVGAILEGACHARLLPRIYAGSHA